MSRDSAYPFTALVGAEELCTALLLNAVSPAIGGVLIRGEKGTAKSTAVRGLAALLPDVEAVAGCPYSCDPAAPDPECPAGPHPPDTEAEVRPARLVELPVGASEDRVAGSLDLEQVLTHGTRAFEPGLLAQAHRGVLYVDEVNLLGDHLVDLLLDAAAMGVNHVEREGVSVRHAAGFQLVGTMNPEEGELRPQLLDRFGLTAPAAASTDRSERTEVVRRRMAYEADPTEFAAAYAESDAEVAARIRAARKLLPEVVVGETALAAVAAACTAFAIDGLRADIVTAKTAAALAAWEGRTEVAVRDVRAAALLSLPHRRRRGPFEEPGIDESVLDEALEGLDDEPPPDGPGSGGSRPDQSADGQDPSTGSGTDGEPVQAEADSSSAGGSAGPEQPRDAVGDDSTAGADETEAGPQSDGGGSDEGEAEPGQTGAGQDSSGLDDAGQAGVSTLPVGGAFPPVRLEAGGVGGGPAGRRSAAESTHGHHVSDRAPRGRVRDLAVEATVRTAARRRAQRSPSGQAGLAESAESAETSPTQLRPGPGDLREKVRQGREGNLVLFAVDASGSMAARQRMTAVKGAVWSLLVDAYQRRDRVGVVTFAGDDAHVAVPPTASVETAERMLDALPTGGRTPLAAGLECAATVVAAERIRQAQRRPLLVALTDGRATSAGGSRASATEPVEAACEAAAGLANQGVPGLVVDTESGAVRLGLAARVAGALGAPTLRLEGLAAGAGEGSASLATAVKAFAGSPPGWQGRQAA
jgi:magnesium chelatase subunit D